MGAFGTRSIAFLICGVGIRGAGIRLYLSYFFLKEIKSVSLSLNGNVELTRNNGVFVPALFRSVC